MIFMHKNLNISKIKNITSAKIIDYKQIINREINRISSEYHFRTD